MSGPNETMSAPDLWLAITSQPRPHRIVDFPRIDKVTSQAIGQVAIVVLTQEEQMHAAANAEQYTKRILKDPTRLGDASRGYDAVFSNESAVQILFRACKKAEDMQRGEEKNFFPAPELIRKHLSVDEVGVLFSHYLSVQTSIGPITASMDDSEVEAWVTRLAEGGAAFPLDLLSPESLKALAFFMACRLHEFMRAQSSPGSPQDEPQMTLESSGP